MNFSNSLEFERLRAHIKPVVRKLAPAFRRLGFEYEDVEQEALIVALECQTIEYLRKALNWRLIDILRRHGIKRHRVRPLISFLLRNKETQQLFDGIPYLIDPSYERQEEERDAREEIDYYLARSGMSSRDRAIVRRYAQGATLKEAGAEFGVSKMYASRIVSRFITICRYENSKI